MKVKKNLQLLEKQYSALAEKKRSYNHLFIYLIKYRIFYTQLFLHFNFLFLLSTMVVDKCFFEYQILYRNYDHSYCDNDVGRAYDILKNTHLHTRLSTVLNMLIIIRIMRQVALFWQKCYRQFSCLLVLFTMIVEECFWMSDTLQKLWSQLLCKWCLWIIWYLKTLVCIPYNLQSWAYWLQ